VIAVALALATSLAAAPLAQDDLDAPPSYQDEEDPSRIRLTLWGGEALATGRTRHASTLYGGEAAWAFETLDLGVAAYGYQSLLQSTREWTPVVLARLTQRFRTRRMLEAAFTFGVGAGRPRADWSIWLQVALGVRYDLGPMFLAGEIAFEQNDLLRLAGGVGVKF
jgi:hypothetical protein